MKILIISKPSDGHAAAVGWGLRELGYSAVLWHWADFPKHDTSSIWIDRETNSGPNFMIGVDNINAPFDVIWHRRPTTPMPRQDSNELDHKVIKNESYTYLKGIREFLGHRDTFWVNHWLAAQNANNKIEQLVIAKEIGFAIPATLISNNPADVREFYARHGNIITKTFRAGGWYSADGTGAVLKTARIAAEHLTNDEPILACPAIFQTQIEKESEVRVTVMGDQVLAGVIRSQDAKATVDWRYEVKIDHTTFQAITLPDDVHEKCLRLCRTLGLVFGCIDLIVDKNGNYIFLEINEAGQFLWKEDASPGLLMLDTFCKFLIAKGKNDVDATGKTLHIADFDQSDAGKQFIKTVQQPIARKESMFTFEG